MVLTFGFGWSSSRAASTERGYCDPDVFIGEVVVDRDRRSGPLAGSSDDLGTRIHRVAGSPHPANRGHASAIDGCPTLVVDLSAQACKEVVVPDERRPHEHCSPGHEESPSELDTRKSVVLDNDPTYGAFDDSDGSGSQLLALLVGELSGVCEEDDIVAPLPDQQCVLDRHGVPAQDTEGLVTDLVTVAVRAVQDIAAPPLGHAVYVDDLVAQARGDEQPASSDRSA